MSDPTNTLKMYRFKVQNMRTREVAGFLGQGMDIAEAFKEGLKNCSDPFRPNSNGKKTHEHGIGVTLPDGREVSRTVKEFESDVPYGAQS